MMCCLNGSMVNWAKKMSCLSEKRKANVWKTQHKKWNFWAKEKGLSLDPKTAPTGWSKHARERGAAVCAASHALCAHSWNRIWSVCRCSFIYKLQVCFMPHAPMCVRAARFFTPAPCTRMGTRITHMHTHAHARNSTCKLICCRALSLLTLFLALRAHWCAYICVRWLCFMWESSSLQLSFTSTICLFMVWDETGERGSEEERKEGRKEGRGWVGIVEEVREGKGEERVWGKEREEMGMLNVLFFFRYQPFCFTTPPTTLLSPSLSLSMWLRDSFCPGSKRTSGGCLWLGERWWWQDRSSEQ